MSLHVNPVSLPEVKDLVGKLSQKKKTLGEKLHDERTLFNSILIIGYFPKV